MAGARRTKWLLWLVIGGMTLPLLLAAVTILLPRLRERQVYTDSQTIRQPRDQARVRDVLWEPPQVLAWGSGDGQDAYEPQAAADGQALFFVRGQPGAGADIWFSRRNPEGWTPPELLAAVNSRYDDLGPAPAPDGRTLFFYSDRPGGQGGYDLWMSRLSAAGWEAPVNLGPDLNSRFNDYAPAPAPDGLRLYFASDRPRAAPAGAAEPAEPADPTQQREGPEPRRDYDLYQADLSADSPSGVAPLALINTSFNEGTPAVSPLGDFLYFASDRPGGCGGYDLYRSRLLEEGPQPPAPLGVEVNSPAHELDPSIDQAGFGLCFSSNRSSDQAGQGFHLYYSRSREVFLDIERVAFDIGWAELWRRLLPGLLGSILALAGILVLAALLQRARSGRLTLLTRCLLASVLVHMVLLMLLSFWNVGGVLADTWRRGERYRVTLASPARDSLAHQIQGGLGPLEGARAPEYPEAARDDAVPSAEQTQLVVQSPAPAMELPAPLPAVSALSAADSAIPPGSRPAEAAVDFAPASTPLDARLPQPRALSVAEPAVDRPRPDAGSTQPDTGIPMDANIDPITAQLAPARSGSADVVPSGSTLARPSRPADSKAVRADLPAVELNGPPAPHAPPLPVPAQRPWPARPEPSLGEPDPLSNAITPEPAAGTGSLPADRLLVAAMVTSPPVDQPEPAAGSTLAAVTPLRDLPPRELSFSGSPPVAEVPPVPAVMQLPLPAVSAAGPAPVVAESALRPVGAPSVQSAGPADLPPGQIAARGHVSVAPLAQSAPAGGSLVETATASEVRWQPASAPQRSAALMQPLEPELPLLEEQSYAAEPGEAPSLAVSAVGRARLAARRADMPAESPVPAPPVIIAPAEPDANQAAAPTLAARLTPREADDSRVASLATGPAAPAAPGPAPLPSPPVDDVARPGTAVDRDPPPAAGPLAVPGLAPRDIEVAVPDSPRQQLAPLAPQEERLPEDTSLAATVTIDRELEAVQAAPVSASTTLPLPPLRLPEMRVPQETVPPDSPLAGRSPEVRKELITRMGGSDETEAAVALALDWLGRHQSPDGRWDSDEFDDGCGRCGSGTHIEADVALTGLAVLSFLAADHTHFKKGPYQERVDRALRWLISQQGRDGDLRGGETMYSHGIATIALAEGLAMTADDRLVQPVHRAVFFIYAARNLDVGGWRYDPGQPGDTSVLGWQIMALKSAERAGMEIPAGCYETGQRWLQRVAEQPGSGLYSYRPGRRPTPAMTAEAMYTLQLMGARRDEPRMRLSAAYLTQNLPDWDEANTYYWYYATLALHQHQGRSWQRWNEEMKRELIGNQVRDGSPAGSWPPTDRWAAVGGRVYQTALCALMLESYYRYLPMYASEEEQR